jgi:hypothetical protein
MQPGLQPEWILQLATGCKHPRLSLICFVPLLEVMHLAGCYFAMDSTASVHQILYKSQKTFDGDTSNDRQAFGEESMSITLIFEWHVRCKADRKRREEQTQEHAQHCL